MIRVVLPYHLKNLAKIEGEALLDVPPPVTANAIVDALEAKYPALGGTIREYSTRKRRPLVRFYGCEQDLSHEPPDEALPEPIANGSEPFLIVGAIAGG